MAFLYLKDWTFEWMLLYLQTDPAIYYTIITINTHWQIEFYKGVYKLHLSTSFLYKLQAVQAFGLESIYQQNT